MFDLQDALRQWNGREFDFTELRKILRQIRLEHIGQLPPEVTSSELLLIARQNHWIQEDENGKLHVNINIAA